MIGFDERRSNAMIKPSVSASAYAMTDTQMVVQMPWRTAPQITGYGCVVRTDSTNKTTRTPIPSSHHGARAKRRIRIFFFCGLTRGVVEVSKTTVIRRILFHVSEKVRKAAKYSYKAAKPVACTALQIIVFCCF